MAILVGAGVGALAAFMGGAPSPRETPTPARTTSLLPLGEAAPARPEPTTAAPPASARPEPPAPPAPKAEPSELTELPVAELERQCALRRARGCLASARAYELGRGVGADPAKARLYRSLAVSLLDERCLGREAEACYDLGELYSTGSGVAKNPETARALTQRARELCAGKTTSFCEKLSAK